MTMGQQFRIEIDGWMAGGSGLSEVQDTTAEIVMSVDSRLITEVEDRHAKTVRKSIRASAYLLASWLVSNWWRLRWEPYKESGSNGLGLDWRLSHSVPATAGGYAWPPVTLASDGRSILLKCEADETPDDAALAPIRYLNSFSIVVEPEGFESAIAGFVERVLARLDSLGCRETPLHSLWSDVREERKSEKKRSRRKLEALLGLDPDDNSELIDKLLDWQAKVGTHALEEIAAASESRHIQTELDKAKVVASSVKTFAEITAFEVIKTRLDKDAPSDAVPWKLGRRAANALREAWGLGKGPVSTRDIAERLQIPQAKVEEFHPEAPFSLGVRGKQEEKLKLVLNRGHEHSRRFDLARLIGDHLMMETDDQWRPATRSLTARQKFQRAFAAEFLCLSDELAKQYPGPYDVDQLDEITTRISEEYNVSQRVALNHLANRGSIPHLVRSNDEWREEWYVIRY